MCSRRFTTGLCLGTSLGVFCLQASAETDYLADVKPILQECCLACHEGLKQQDSWRLDTFEIAWRGVETGAALVPHKPTSSLLIARVSDPDLTTRTPPYSLYWDWRSAASTSQDGNVWRSITAIPFTEFLASRYANDH